MFKTIKAFLVCCALITLGAIQSRAEVLNYPKMGSIGARNQGVSYSNLRVSESGENVSVSFDWRIARGNGSELGQILVAVNGKVVKFVYDGPASGNREGRGDVTFRLTDYTSGAGSIELGFTLEYSKADARKIYEGAIKPENRTLTARITRYPPISIYQYEGNVGSADSGVTFQDFRLTTRGDEVSVAFFWRLSRPGGSEIDQVFLAINGKVVRFFFDGAVGNGKRGQGAFTFRPADYGNEPCNIELGTTAQFNKADARREFEASHTAQQRTLLATVRPKRGTGPVTRANFVLLADSGFIGSPETGVTYSNLSFTVRGEEVTVEFDWRIMRPSRSELDQILVAINGKVVKFVYNGSAGEGRQGHGEATFRPSDFANFKCNIELGFTADFGTAAAKRNFEDPNKSTERTPVAGIIYNPRS